jgi:peptidoglycan lytic transglycosylase A
MTEDYSCVKLEPVGFEDLPLWSGDDHRAALQAFSASAPVILRGNRSIPGLKAACRAAVSLASQLPDGDEAREFFERHFEPHRIRHSESAGLLTGYFEPELPGSRVRTSQFHIPVYSRPPNLINLVGESERGAYSDRLTHARRKPDGSIEAYFTRRKIDEGALKGLGLEILYLADPVEAFFMQIQGSGLVRFGDKSAVRLAYAGKNGHPYVSIGRHLIETGVFEAEAMNLKTLKSWLKADPDRARAVLWVNPSYVFFRSLGPERETRPLGTDDIPLHMLRSLAVDTRFHDLGLPIYMSAPALHHVVEGATGFHRLMVAHDVGSAIVGPERGDLFCGSGARAGAIAGLIKHAVNFFMLRPRVDAETSQG